MPSAEATLQVRTEVGNSSSTRPQTLLNLLNLYETADTDRQKWVDTIESHPTTLLAFLAAAGSIAPVESLADWHNDLTLAHLRSITLALLNQQVGTSLNRQATDEANETVVAFASLLCKQLDPELSRQATLTCRLLGSQYQSTQADVEQALRFFNRPPVALHDTSLLTRIAAVAWQLSNATSSSSVADELADECAGLLDAPVSLIEECLKAISGFSRPVDDPETSQTLTQRLAMTNLRESTLQLAQLTDNRTALLELTAALFDGMPVKLFLQEASAWSDGHLVLSGEHSIVARAAATGKLVSTAAHSMTVIDEEMLTAMNLTDAVAVPILLEPPQPESCAVVVLMGMKKSALLELSGENELMVFYQSVARDAFSIMQTPGISLEEVDQHAREVIHEANNPLSTIRNYLKVLSMKLDPAHEAQATLQTIESELVRAATIISGFRDIRSQAGQSDNRCTVGRVVDEAISLFKAGYSEVEFRQQFDSNDREAAISADDLKQILTNLIKNAIEAIKAKEAMQEQGRIDVELACDLKQGGQTLIEITVRDNGPGLPGEIDDVFERGATTKSGEHMGEGLAIVKRLTERAGGFISYRTSNGPVSGAEFRVTLPQYI